MINVNSAVLTEEEKEKISHSAAQFKDWVYTKEAVEREKEYYEHRKAEREEKQWRTIIPMIIAFALFLAFLTANLTGATALARGIVIGLVAIIFIFGVIQVFRFDMDRKLLWIIALAVLAGLLGSILPGFAENKTGASLFGGCFLLIAIILALIITAKGLKGKLRAEKQWKSYQDAKQAEREAWDALDKTVLAILPTHCWTEERVTKITGNLQAGAATLTEAL